jgi:hypothetical protein
MRDTRAARPIPITLTALVAFFSALAALAVSNGMDMAQAHGTSQPQTPMSMPMSMTMTVHRAPGLTAKAL